MEQLKKYYKYLDILRIVSCIAVFLYHLGCLKGGYLAVCSFFVLSGYLSYISAQKKEKFSFLQYYKEKFFHIYLPFMIVIFISVGVIHYFPKINWLNLKPETTSALLGYNNFWQLKANLDYFARHVDSPFMHFWYMGILLQFDLAFPFLYCVLRKIPKKSITCILLGVFTILSIGYFIYRSMVEENQMILYYHTLTRLFSIFLGLFIGAIHSHYHPILFKKIDARIGFFLYLILLIVACILIDANSPYFMIAMILVTIITGRMITYGTVLYQTELFSFDKVLKYLAKITYEVYLIQYPVIFLFQLVLWKDIIKVPVIIVITVLLSCILHLALSQEKNKYMKVLQILMTIIVGGTAGIGFYYYMIAKDHTAEMKALENQLNQNQASMAEKQKEYAARLKLEEEQLNSALSEIENSEAGLEEYIHSLPVIGIGDSVMLGAFPSLYEVFPNGYFDAKVSRTDYEANRILQDIKNQGLLGNPIVISLGTNGQCGASCQYTILNTIGDRQLFWINVVNDWSVHVNAGLNQLAHDNQNVHIVDWVSASNGHPEYFVADGIHLTGSGRAAFAKTLYDTIYQEYKQEIENKKAKILQDHENSLNHKVSFYGNDVLIKAYDFLQTEFTEFEIEFHGKQEQDIKDILTEIEIASQSNSFPKHVVLFLDSDMELGKEQFQQLEKLPTHIYLVTMNTISYQNTETVTVWSFQKEIEKNESYLMVDRIHLTDEGNQVLAKQLLGIIQK